MQELSNDQVTILSIVERLGYDVAIDRLLAVTPPVAAVVEMHETRPVVQVIPSPGKPQVFSPGSKSSSH